jgi:predicted DNA-binding transcriptional regulator YafY
MLILLLQRRGPLTGREIATELEVSLRTVYRDVDSLERMGVPVVAVAGPHGGYRILEGYRNEFARLTNAETNAILAAAAAGPLAMIGQGPTLRKALDKLAAQRHGHGTSGVGEGIDPERVMIDDARWVTRPEHDPSVLAELVRAVSERRSALVSVLAVPFSPSATEREIEPLGLVNKDDRWFLVYNDTTIRVRAIDTILSAEPAPHRFAPPGDFRLSSFWKSWCAAQTASRSRYRTLLRTDAAIAHLVARYLAAGSASLLVRAEPLRKGDTVELDCRFGSFEEARARILGLGSAAQVVAPGALRLGIVDYARQILQCYSTEDERSVRTQSQKNLM